ncbi:MAG: hypothetical protein HFI70_03860 [Lachnospiraceae bacterium]|nr:hypothetical protein [Lachnospiraceae bacterium]
MTDNEKRAHDLAITLLPAMIDSKAQNIAENNSTNSVNPVDCYMELYKNALKSFNREFSAGK